MSLRRRLTVLVAATCLPSCTLVGLGAGATVDAMTDPVYDEHAARELPPLSRGQPLRVAMKNGSAVSGDYFGTRGPIPNDLDTYLWVQMPDASVRALAYSDVNRVGVETPEVGWVSGMTIGLLLDVVGFMVLKPIVEDQVEISMEGAEFR